MALDRQSAIWRIHITWIFAGNSDGRVADENSDQLRGVKHLCSIAARARPNPIVDSVPVTVRIEGQIGGHIPPNSRTLVTLPVELLPCLVGHTRLQSEWLASAVTGGEDMEAAIVSEARMQLACRRVMDEGLAIIGGVAHLHRCV